MCQRLCQRRFESSHPLPPLRRSSSASYGLGYFKVRARTEVIVMLGSPFWQLEQTATVGLPALGGDGHEFSGNNWRKATSNLGLECEVQSGGGCARPKNLHAVCAGLQHIDLASLSQRVRWPGTLALLQPDSRLHCTPEVRSGSKAESLRNGRTSAFASCGHDLHRWSAAMCQSTKSLRDSQRPRSPAASIIPRGEIVGSGGSALS